MTGVIVGFTVLMALSAQQPPPRAPVVQAVDLLVPFAPVMFKQAGSMQLAYELHITNFLSVDVSLNTVQVKASNGQTLAEYKDAELQGRMVRPGFRNDHATPHVLGAGARAVVNFWIALPAGPPPPAEVKHVVELDLLRPAGSFRTVVEGGVSAAASQAIATLDSPLRGGPWVAIYDPLLKGGHRTAIYTVDGRARIPGRFAIDFIALPPAGVLVRNPAVRPDDWNGFGSDVLAVADGTVVAALDDTPDETPKPVAVENASGNYVAIDLGDGRFAFYEHLQRGSVAVKTGQRVRRGQVIAKLGSSGSTSIGPHLHFHVADASSLLAAEGLPFVFREFAQLGEYASIDALVNGEKPSLTAGDRRAELERPAPNSVVRFPSSLRQ
jgi:murein DD-endopeptidase